MFVTEDLCFTIPGFTIQHQRQPLQDQQDDEDTNVCANPQLDPIGSSVQVGPVLQWSGESELKHQTIFKVRSAFKQPLSHDSTKNNLTANQS